MIEEIQFAWALLLIISSNIATGCNPFFMKAISLKAAKRNMLLMSIALAGIVITIYVAASFLDMLAFSYAPISRLYPAAAISYLVSILCAVLFLKEKISLHQMLGILLILAGIIMSW